MATTLNTAATSSEAQLQKLLVEWNDTDTDYPRHLCVHQLFEQQAERRPQAIALQFRNQQMTYEQLNRRANQVAHRLRRLGVGPEVMVGTLLERSLEMAVGLLGILKAGGAFVPFDANYPADRLAFMASDTRSPVILVQSSVLQKMAGESLSAATLVSLDADATPESVDNLANVNSAESLAYVMYTSGSTG